MKIVEMICCMKRYWEKVNQADYLTAPHTHYSLKTLWPSDIPSKIVVKLCRIRKSWEWVIIINLEKMRSLTFKFRCMHQICLLKQQTLALRYTCPPVVRGMVDMEAMSTYVWVVTNTSTQTCSITKLLYSTHPQTGCSSSSQEKTTHNFNWTKK
jgi:hypothetical protein